MKMIMAFVRPEMVEKVASMLGDDGFAAYTRVDVYGRGRQKGVQVLGQSYDMPKTMLMTVVEDDQLGEAVSIIGKSAQTGNAGDGKIFVLPVEQAYTVRTGEIGL
ncbi:MAG: putative nitrogen regulatory PII-like protein [Methanosaeta sp. PtaU1.Bin060]|jgi:nitrogen regulatory protein PII 1|nr:MAG: putative nitrogen regulatory PII-like protein [Methanosaeta sp. PtaU1.Bin060]